MKPLIVTMGDPTGVGPEIILKSLVSGALDSLEPPLRVAGDPGILQRAASVLGAKSALEPGPGDGTVVLRAAGRSLCVHPLSNLNVENALYGHPDEGCGRAMAQYIEWACDRCLQGEAGGIVTAPINKAAINAAGYPFPGHTEMLALRCATPKVVMMLAGERLRVCLVTTHLSYRDVPGALSSAEILETIRITDAALRCDFSLLSPRIAVLALNPHAGEGGLFGDEEARLIAPAIRQARDEGIEATGPHSADTLFYFAAGGAYDAVVCMYHDQGLIPLKLLHFEDGVNVTLGLPIVRTSVDHGTAYDLAGTGKASEKSLVAAIRTAEKMVKGRSGR